MSLFSFLSFSHNSKRKPMPQKQKFRNVFKSACYVVGLLAVCFMMAPKSAEAKDLRIEKAGLDYVDLNWEPFKNDERRELQGYRLYYSTNRDNVKDEEKAEDKALLWGDYAPDETSARVTGLTPLTEYYFNVVVSYLKKDRDEEEERKEDYGEREATTLPPEIDDKALEVGAVTSTAAELSWNHASSNPDYELEYRVYHSTSPIRTLKEIKRNGRK